MATHKVEFTGGGGETLSGVLHVPPGKARAGAVFAHGFTLTKDLRAARIICDSLCDRGFAVLRFDFAGLGGSSGEFADQTFTANVGDLVAAAEFMRDTLRNAPRLLVGHSLGGAAVLLAAAELDCVKAVVTIGAPSDPAHVSHLFESVKHELETDGVAIVTLGGRQFCVRKQFIDDLTRHSLGEVVAKLRVALLVCHAPLDNVVGVDNARLIFEAAKHPKSFVSLDNADHLLRNVDDAEYAAAVIAAWASRYIKSAPAEYEGQRRVVVHGGQLSFEQQIGVGPHALTADEPPTVPGGEDRGPSPYEYLLAGLGACTSMTLRMYAKRKGWPLDGVEVSMLHDKIHAEDCEASDTKAGKIDCIDRAVTLRGDLTPEQRARLLEIADMCPVHRTLERKVHVVTREVDAKGPST